MTEKRLNDLSDDELLTLLADLEAAHERAEDELMARRRGGERPRNCAQAVTVAVA